MFPKHLIPVRFWSEPIFNNQSLTLYFLEVFVGVLQ